MGNHLRIHSPAASAIALSLSLSAGCQGRPKPVPPPAARASAVAVVPASRNPSPRHETIFFLKANASLSPGALKKLKAWVAAWGTNGNWVISCPANPGTASDLREKRFQAVRSQLQKLGVLKIETKLLPAESPGKYDAVYIEK